MSEQADFPTEQVGELFKAEFQSKYGLMLVNLSTVDGFLLKQVNQTGEGIEGDKIAAISSSICSMSQSASRELLGSASGITNIESDDGKIIFQHVNLGQKEGVITLCCNKDVSLAEGRFAARRLKEAIEALLSQ